MKKVLIIGAASAIAEAVAREFAAQGAAVFLVGRTPQKLEAIAADLRVRGAAQVGSQCMDATDYPAHAEMLRAADAAMGGLDYALIAHGTLPDQAACAADVNATLTAMDVNATSVISLATLIANHLEQRGSGCLAVISSVAGDRGRASNYVYGSAKAAVTAFCSGLAVRMLAVGVRVLTIKPGFVDTPMTAEFKKGALWASPQAVGQRIHRAMLKEQGTVYVPGFWRYIMLIIRHIPEFVFLKLKKL